MENMKRIFDLSLTILGGICIFPLLILIYILILQSGRPAIFKHNRIGKDGKSFPCFKFRTMFIDADIRLQQLLTDHPELRQEWESSFKLADDPRITAIGKFLRKTSLDELPQLLNVLRGEMSLVGPRPILQEELDKFYTDEERKLYYSTTPGITGLWQVMGRSDLDYPTRVKLDMEYISKQSLWFDICILVKTVWVVLHRKGAK